MMKTLLHLRTLAFACLLTAGHLLCGQALVDQPFGWAVSGGSVTGGGNASPVTVTSNSAFRSAVSGSSPKVVHVSGTIDLGIANMANIGANTTIIGIGSNATLLHGGIKLSGVSNVIIRNLNLKDARDPNWQCETPTEGGQPSNCTSSNAEYDLMVIQSGSSRIWIDHCSFENHQTTDLAYDGQLDIKNGSDYITVSYCVFSNSRKTNLIGSSDSDTGSYRITWAYNWWNGTTSRNPMIRFGNVHLLNNYYTNVSSYCIGVRINSRIYAEGNYFLNCANPGDQQTSSGQLRDVGNAFSNCTPNSFDSPVSSVGWTPSYSYTALSASQVPSHVTANAGAGNMNTSGGGSNCGACGSGIVDGGTYRITPRHAQSMGLELYNFDNSNGANINQWTYWGGDYQHWVAEDRGNGYWSFHPATATGKAMDVWGMSTSNGANIALYDYWGGDGQLWYFANAGSGGWVRIYSKLSDLGLDISGGGTGDGTNLLQWQAIANAQNQMFRFESVSGSRQAASVAEQQIEIYPNPTSDKATIRLSAEYLSASPRFILFNAAGQKIQSQIIEKTQTDVYLDQLNAGIYFVELRIGNTKQITKLVKQ